MSRSYRKTKIFGNVGGSEKWDKRLNNKMFRKKSREAINMDSDPPFSMNEVRSTWVMNKDGKHYWEDATDKDMRK